MAARTPDRHERRTADSHCDGGDDDKRRAARAAVEEVLAELARRGDLPRRTDAGDHPTATTGRR
jgi:hypothetical protein